MTIALFNVLPQIINKLNSKNKKLVVQIQEAWLKGFNTHNWNDYIALLSDDYVFEVPGEGKSKNSAHKALVLSEFLKNKGVQEIRSEPIRITDNGRTIVFEFDEPTSPNDELHKVKFALSFDYRDGVITAHREYFDTD